MKNKYIRPFDTISSKDIKIVGGKNASLGEMIQFLKDKKISLPDGFATTALAFWEFLEENKLSPKIDLLLKDFKRKKKSVQQVGKEIRNLILNGKFSEKFTSEITSAYHNLSKLYNTKDVDVAVRSSATAEDLPTASFAGQLESFLNIKGQKKLLSSCLKCYASLFTDRVICYRQEKKFDHLKIAVSVGVQKMVRSDKAGAGVMFTLDTETGFRDVIVINGGFGLGENVVQGNIIPDEYVVFKPLLKNKKYIPIVSKTLGQKEKKMIYGQKKPTKNIKTPLKERRLYVLSDKEILQLARWGQIIENHYQEPLDIEWAKDGKTKKLFIVQARPETVESQKEFRAFKSYSLKEKGEILLQGIAIGEAIAIGKVQVIKTIKDIKQFKEGNILVTKTTSPDWVPIMKKAVGIITDHGGRTSHAAIVSRELGIPAIVGTNRATQILKNGQEITLSCTQGDIGYIYNKILKYTSKQLTLKNIKEPKIPIMMNISSPIGAFRWWRLPCKGIGLARIEFIITNIIQIHPLALIHFDKIEDRKTKKKIENLTQGYRDKTTYFIDNLSLSIAHIAASQYPYPVIVRMSDFKTNEYAQLIGGKQFEPLEENPMLGFRGACRYYSDRYRPGFFLECQAIKKVREVMGFKNVIVMIPFCRTIEEADRVLKVLADFGLKRKKENLEIYVMCEIPSNVILAEEFAKRFDGFSIGSNDLTQLTLGIDRDSEELSHLFDARNPAVKRMIHSVIKQAHKKKCKVGICGQAPSDHPDFAKFLVQEKIDSISLNPDSVLSVIKHLSKIETNK